MLFNLQLFFLKLIKYYRSNFIGTEFNIYDSGENPKNSMEIEKVREQLGVAIYVFIIYH